jgi:hypothetical protein
MINVKELKKKVDLLRDQSEQSYQKFSTLCDKITKDPHLTSAEINTQIAQIHATYIGEATQIYNQFNEIYSEIQNE